MQSSALTVTDVERLPTSGGRLLGGMPLAFHPNLNRTRTQTHTPTHSHAIFCRVHAPFHAVIARSAEKKSICRSRVSACIHFIPEFACAACGSVCISKSCMGKHTHTRTYTHIFSGPTSPLPERNDSQKSNHRTTSLTLSCSASSTTSPCRDKISSL